MRRHIAEILSSGLFVFLATYVLQIHGQSIWTLVENWAGELVLMGLLVAVCASLGAVFSAVTGVRFWDFVIGGIAYYLTMLVYLEVTAGPFDSPVHILINILFLIGFGLGVGVVEIAERRGVMHRLELFGRLTEKHFFG